jgi:hypothetical protein
VPRIACAVIAALLAIAVAGCGSSSAPSNLTATITVQDGKPKGGSQDLKVKKGGEIKLTVDSDTADEVHIHGYDLHKDVEKGGSVSFDFPATIDGAFEIELEAAKEQLAKLSVEP